MMLPRADPDEVPPTARVFWMAHHWRVRVTFTDRYELECLDGGAKRFRTLPRDKVPSLKLTGDIVVEPYYFDIDGRPAKSGSFINMLAAKPISEQREIMIAYIKASMFQEDYKRGKVVLYETRRPSTTRRRRRAMAVTADVWLAQNDTRIQEAVRPYRVLDSTAVQGHEKPRLHQTPPPSLGSVSTLKADRRKLVAKGFIITHLARDRAGMRHGGRKMEPDMAAFALNSMRKVMLQLERMTLSAFRKHLSAEIRHNADMAHRTVPSLGALENLIDTLDDATAICAWFGITKMVQSRTIFSEGPEYTYPGQLVLMDCWKIDLVARLNEQGGWLFVPDKELKEEWGVRRRLWIAVVIDTCTRAILGFALGLSENTDLTRSALRMSITDKTLQCIDAGCKASPIPPIGLDAIHTDIGPAFKHPHFSIPAFSLTKDLDIGPGEKAHLRGLIERLLRTVKDAVLAYFTGTTFGNVHIKGDYPAFERASADVRTLGQGLWLYFNDVYNLSQHHGIDSQTPINRFEELFNDEGAADIYTEEYIRMVFGLQFKAPVTREGVCFASNQYVSGALQDYFKRRGSRDGKLIIMVDPQDLGRISIFFEGAWHTLSGPARMRRIGLTAWLELRKQLAQRYRDQYAVRAHIVAAALLRLQRMGTEARLKYQVRDMGYDSHEVREAVNRVALRIKEDETPTVPGALHAFDASSTEASFLTSGGADYADIGLEVDEQDDRAAKGKVDDGTGLDGDQVDIDGDPIEPNDRNEQSGIGPDLERRLIEPVILDVFDDEPPSPVYVPPRDAVFRTPPPRRKS